jgi:hypothetical protein
MINACFQTTVAKLQTLHQFIAKVEHLFSSNVQKLAVLQMNTTAMTNACV